MVCVWVKCGHTTVLRWRRSEDNSEVAFLFLLSHTSRDRTQVRKFVWQVLSPTETSHQAEKSCLFNNESYSNREKEQQQPLAHPKYNNFHYPCFCSEDQTIFWKTTAFVLNIHGCFLTYGCIILYNNELLYSCVNYSHRCIHSDRAIYHLVLALENGRIGIHFM